jgi:hypothetical protein
MIARRRALALVLAPLLLATGLLAAGFAWVFEGGPDVVPRPAPALGADTPTSPLEAAAATRDPEAAAGGAVRACADSTGSGRFSCYEGFLERRLDRAGLEDALEALRGLAARDPAVEPEGHVYVHGLGIAAYQREPDLAATFARCSELYSSGCYHGVMQAYFDDERRTDPVDLEAVCRPFKAEGRSRWLLFQCVHGMGHGLLMHRDHDLPQALSDCDRLSDGWDRESCFGGVFMENLMSATAPHHPATLLAAHHHGGSAPAATWRPIDPTNPLYPCSAVALRYQTACYLNQTSLVLFLSHGDFAAAGRACGRAPRAMQPTCYQSLGRDAGGYARSDADSAIRLCAHAGRRLRPWCYAGAVKTMTDETSSAPPGFVFCARVPDHAGKLRCYEALGEQIAALEAGLPERAALCEGGERAYVDACRYGARLTDRRPSAAPAG